MRPAHREVQTLPTVFVQLSPMEFSKEKSQQAWYAGLQPDPLGFTCSDSGPRSGIWGTNWIQPEPPVTWG